MIKHIYHYNIPAEKKYFLGKENRQLYDIIALSGNIVSHTPSAIAAFLATANKDFFIDPQTHAFQHSTKHLKRDVSDKSKGEPPKYEFKPSLVKLAEQRLEEPFNIVTEEDRPLSYKDFFIGDDKLDDDIINKTCETVLNFQLNTIIESISDDDKEFLDSNSNTSPMFLIAPYFYLSPVHFEKWLKINSACYIRCKDIQGDKEIVYSLVISKEVLLLGGGDDVIQELAKFKPDGVILWIDNLVEESLTVPEIRKLIDFLREMKKHTKFIYNTHGGFLSILLCHSDLKLLDGVGHSVNYGEARSVIPVGGGIPRARFYFPSIHSRLKFADALDIIRKMGWLDNVETYRQNVCKCTKCQELFTNDKTLNTDFIKYGESHTVKSRRKSGTIVSLEYPTRETKEIASYHYLYNKAHEFDIVKTKTLKDLLQAFADTHTQLEINVGDDLIGHLYNWHKSL